MKVISASELSFTRSLVSNYRAIISFYATDKFPLEKFDELPNLPPHSLKERNRGSVKGQLEYADDSKCIFCLVQRNIHLLLFSSNL